MGSLRPFPNDGSLEDYLKSVQETPLLTAEQERVLAKRMKRRSSRIESQQADARAARDGFIRANLRLVVSIAKGFINRGLPLLDLIEEGNLGLLKAVEKFDLRKNCRFSTYATWWIRQAIRRGLLNTSKTVRVPSYMVEIIARWKGLEHAFMQEHGRRPLPDEVAGDMGLGRESLAILKRAIRTSNQASPVSLDSLWLNEGTPFEPQAPEGFLSTADTERLQELLATITPREASVLRFRFGLYDGQPMRLVEIGKELGITRERVRQIEKTALKKLRLEFARSQEPAEEN